MLSNFIKKWAYRTAQKLPGVENINLAMNPLSPGLLSAGTVQKSVYTTSNTIQLPCLPVRKARLEARVRRGLVPEAHSGSTNRHGNLPSYDRSHQHWQNVPASRSTHASASQLSAAQPAPQQQQEVQGHQLPRAVYLSQQFRPDKAFPNQSASSLDSITGTVQRIHYRSEKTFYTVLRLAVSQGESGSPPSKNRGESVTVVGSFLDNVAIGQTLRLQGNWTEHPQYGRQLVAAHVEIGRPSATEDLVGYLAGSIDGVGPATARILVERWGADIPEVLDSSNAIEQLIQCQGIGRVSAEKIKGNWDAKKATREGVMYLKELGLPMALGQKIAERHGHRTIDAITQDPYKATFGLGLSLSRVDALAAAAGSPCNLASRAAVGILECLAMFADEEGHSYVTWELLESRVAKVLQVSAQLHGLPWSLSNAGELGHVAKLMTAGGMLVAEPELPALGGGAAAPSNLDSHPGVLHGDIRPEHMQQHLLEVLPGIKPKHAEAISLIFGQDTITVLLLPRAQALKQLTRCPGIGVRTAEKILDLVYASTSDGGSIAGRHSSVMPEGLALRDLNRIEADFSPGFLWSSKTRCFLPHLHQAEKVIAESLSARAAARGDTPTKRLGRIRSWLKKVKEQSSIEFSKGQERAVELASDAPLLVITGGPGCGKTTVVQAIVKLWCAQGKLVKICAPTGRAAQRMGTIQGIEPSTIHRMLGYKPREGASIEDEGETTWLDKFEHTADNPLPAGAILIDEASMLSLPLAAALFSALPPKCQVVLVGDTDQLPSIGPGAVLQSVIDSSIAPVVDLREIFRQAAESCIVRSALSVRRGHPPKLVRLPEATPEALQAAVHDALLFEADSVNAVPKAVEMVVDALRKSSSEFRGDQLQVITPMRKGLAGTSALNPMLQALLNPPNFSKPEINRPSSGEHSRGFFRLGDRVLQQVNNYDKDVFNGDQGVIVTVKPEERKLVVEYPHLIRQGNLVPGEEMDSGRRVYTGAEMHQLELAYAITVHKAQGGEAHQVVLALSPAHGRMLTRRLLYTALTRAKHRLIVVATGGRDGDPIACAARQAHDGERMVALLDRLKAERKRRDICITEPMVFSNEENVLGFITDEDR